MGVNVWHGQEPWIKAAAENRSSGVQNINNLLCRDQTLFPGRLDRQAGTRLQAGCNAEARPDAG